MKWENLSCEASLGYIKTKTGKSIQEETESARKWKWRQGGKMGHQYFRVFLPTVNENTVYNSNNAS
jgi:hypothetical protein